MARFKTLWHIDLLLSKDLETNNDITAVAMQRNDKHAFTTIVTVENGVFYSVRVKEF
jgi:nicotinate-nucleotide pyrophosphorylase